MIFQNVYQVQLISILQLIQEVKNISMSMILKYCLACQMEQGLIQVSNLKPKSSSKWCLFGKSSYRLVAFSFPLKFNSDTEKFIVFFYKDVC